MSPERQPTASGPYRRRILDDELDQLMPALTAIALEGAKAVGKTATATRRAKTVYRLDDETQRSIAEADLDRLLDAVKPILIDEWQHVPPVWDKVRRAVDDGAAPMAARSACNSTATCNASSTVTSANSATRRVTQTASVRVYAQATEAKVSHFPPGDQGPSTSGQTIAGRSSVADASPVHHAPTGSAPHKP